MQEWGDNSSSGLGHATNSIVTADQGLVRVPDLKTLERLTSHQAEVKVVNLKGCKTKRDLISRLGKGMNLPDYSSPNWDSFEECLAELEWFAEGRLVMALTEQVDSDLDESDLATLFTILRDVSREWASQGQRQLAAVVVGDVPQSFTGAIQQSDQLWISL